MVNNEHTLQLAVTKDMYVQLVVLYFYNSYFYFFKRQEAVYPFHQNDNLKLYAPFLI